MEAKEYFTIPDAAKICGVSRTTMWRWVKSGNVKAHPLPLEVDIEFPKLISNLLLLKTGFTRSL